MNIIKLSAISSTNDYLKQLSKECILPNFTTVSAEVQTNGKGQMGEKWQAESGKSLLFSVLINQKVEGATIVFLLNVLIALAVIDVLKTEKLNGLSVKWPNDILSYNKKIGGILIENMFKANGEIHTIVGIGLNFYQTDFQNLPQASSILHTYQIKVEREKVMLKIIEYIKNNIAELADNADFWWDKYHENLYKKDVLNLFEKNGKTFNGIIRGVTRDGFLQLEDESGKIQTYGLKEVKMVY